MNKRGHVGTLLLFFGALVLVGVALFSFVSFNNDVKSISGDIDIVVNQINFAYRFNEIVFDEMADEAFGMSEGELEFEKVFRENFEGIARERKLNDGVTDIVFDRIESGKYEVDSEKVVILDIGVRASIKGYKMEREFDLERKFVG
jgi:hypothetical protein